MRASIEHRIRATTFEGEALIGSIDPVAIYQEAATKRIRARSFLGHAAARKEEEIVRKLGEAVGAAIGATRIR